LSKIDEDKEDVIEMECQAMNEFGAQCKKEAIEEINVLLSEFQGKGRKVKFIKAAFCKEHLAAVEK